MNRERGLPERYKRDARGKNEQGTRVTARYKRDGRGKNEQRISGTTGMQ